MKNMQSQKTCSIFKKLIACVIALMFAFLCSFSLFSFSFSQSAFVEQSYAAITVGEETINGYQPSDIVSTDMEISATPEEATIKAENTVIKVTRVIVPILMIACVCIIIYKAIRNIFLPPERRERMLDVIKNIFVQFFFIFFAWIIVEGIVFLVTGGETLLFAVLLS